MSELTSADAGRQHETLRTLMTGYKISQALYVVAKLGVADLLSDGPRTTSTSSHASADSDARSLRRLLQLLAADGFFAESGRRELPTDRRWASYSMSDAPRSDSGLGLEGRRALVGRLGAPSGVRANRPAGFRACLRSGPLRVPGSRRQRATLPSAR